ncbi:myosin-6-like [Portunus trituberculatus]|uniref:myosin-6-like n=1 Tax=Portunus trituberculatus TaxID=210409 RepID=UPI001E1CD8A0|nr:myosin-6-like [Portunus trituberculatus]
MKIRKNVNWIAALCTLCAALAAATGTASGHRHTVQCAGDCQEALALSSSLLEDRRDLEHEVARLTEALEDAQQGNLRLSAKHSDVLGEHLSALLRQEQLTLHHQHEDLRQEHAALLDKHAALLEEHESLQGVHETLRTVHAGLVKDQRDLEAAQGGLKKSYRSVRRELHSLRQQHDSLRQDHLRLQAIKESLLDDVDEMAGLNHQMVEAVSVIRDDWKKTEEARKHLMESLLLKTAMDKRRALTEAEEKYGRLMEEKNALEEELIEAKKNYRQAVQDDETHEETEKRPQDQEGGFHQPQNMVPGDAAMESQESSQQAVEHAERLANAVNEQLLERARLLLEVEENNTKAQGPERNIVALKPRESSQQASEHAGRLANAVNEQLLERARLSLELEENNTKARKRKRKRNIVALKPRESSQQASEHAERLANAVNEQLMERARLLLELDENNTREGQETQKKKHKRKIRERNEL